MIYYIEMNKQMLRDFFISEVLPKRTVINKDGSEIYGYILYSHIHFSSKDYEFLLEINIDLNKHKNIKLKNGTLVLETLYEEFFKIKNIYYTSEQSYQDLLIEKKTLEDVKLIKQQHFIKIEDENQEYMTNDIELNIRDLLYCKTVGEMNQKNDIIYDTLKGSIYMCSALNIENVFTCRQKKIFGQVNELKTEMANINDTHLSIKEKNKVKQTLLLYINNRNKKIRNDNNKFYYMKADKIKINKKVIDNDVLDKIMNIILKEKVKLNNSEDNIIENIIIDLGNLSKKEKDNQIYNDCKTIYSLIIKDSINYSYDDIIDPNAKYLYLALEYFNRLDVLNEIVIDEKFDNYYLIYVFVGAILGYKRLSKLYSNIVKKNEYFRIINYMCKNALTDILISNNINKKYVTENYNIIKKLTNSNNYLKLVNKCCSCKEDNLKFDIKVCGSQKCISLNGVYYIYLNNNETKYFNKEKKNYKININNRAKFQSFKITNSEGKKLNENEIIELNSMLKDILGDI